MAQYPWQVRLPSLAEAFSGAAQMARVKMAIDDRQRQLDANLKRAQAVKQYLGEGDKPGDPTALMLADPELYDRLEGRRLGAEKQRMEMQTQAMAQRQDFAQQRALIAGRVGKAMQQNPQAYQAARRYMAESGYYSPEELPPVEFSPEQAKIFSQQLLGMGQAAGMEMPEAGKPPPEFTRAALDLGYGAGSPKGTVFDAWSDPGIKQAISRQLAASATRGQVNVTAVMGGHADPKNKIITEQQEKLLQGRQTLMILDELKTLATDPQGQQDFQQFLGYLPKAEYWTLNKLSKLSADLVPQGAVPWLTRMATFTAILDKYKAEEYHRLLGGAQTSVEIKNLVNAVLNSDMGSIQFTAAMNALERLTNISMQLATEVHRSGVPLGTSEFASRLDKTVKQKRLEEMDAMAAQLERDNPAMTDAMIAAELYNKGLMPYREAARINPGLSK